MAHTVATEVARGVAGVTDRLKPERGTEGLCLGAAETKNRVALGPHPGEARPSSTTQEVEQHGFRLIVRGVPGEHVGRQDPIPGRPHARLEIRPGFDSDALGNERGPETVRCGSNHVGLARRLGANTVINMDRRNDATVIGRQNEEGQRVGAAGHSAGHGEARIGERAALQQVGRPSHDRPVPHGFKNADAAWGTAGQQPCASSQRPPE